MLQQNSVTFAIKQTQCKLLYAKKKKKTLSKVSFPNRDTQIDSLPSSIVNYFNK